MVQRFSSIDTLILVFEIYAGINLCILCYLTTKTFLTGWPLQFRDMIPCAASSPSKHLSAIRAAIGISSILVHVVALVHFLFIRTSECPSGMRGLACHFVQFYVLSLWLSYIFFMSKSQIVLRQLKGFTERFRIFNLFLKCLVPIYLLVATLIFYLPNILRVEQAYGSGICVCSWPFWAAVVLALGGTAINAAFLYVFLAPLRILQRQLANLPMKQSGGHENATHRTVKRNLRWCSLALISSLSVGVVSSFIQFWYKDFYRSQIIIFFFGSTDLVINYLCMHILMSHKAPKSRDISSAATMESDTVESGRINRPSAGVTLSRKHSGHSPSADQSGFELGSIIENSQQTKENPKPDSDDDTLGNGASMSQESVDMHQSDAVPPKSSKISEITCAVEEQESTKSQEDTEGVPAI